MTLFPKKKPVGYLILGNLRAFGFSAFKAILKFKRHLNHVKPGFLKTSRPRTGTQKLPRRVRTCGHKRKGVRTYAPTPFYILDSDTPKGSKYTDCKFYSLPITSPKQRTKSSGLIGISSYLSFAEIRHRRPAFFMYPAPLTAKMPT